MRSFRAPQAPGDPGFLDASFESFGSILYLRLYAQAGIHEQYARAAPVRQFRQEKVGW